VTWSLRFAEPIALPSGAKLATLREGIAHLVKTVPTSDRNSPTVLTAAELLTSAAEHGPVEFARTATLQAINRNMGRVPDPTRKDPYWGRRKLARDR
jgi:hypothetical protein